MFSLSPFPLFLAPVFRVSRSEEAVPGIRASAGPSADLWEGRKRRRHRRSGSQTLAGRNAAELIRNDRPAPRCCPERGVQQKDTVRCGPPRPPLCLMLLLQPKRKQEFEKKRKPLPEAETAVFLWVFEDSKKEDNNLK